MSPVRIRSYRPGDLADLYRVCLQTGDSGTDATGLFRDPDLLGHVHAAAYGVLEPSLAFVAEDSAGVGGYCLAALDTQAFERRLEQEWWPPLRLRYADPDVTEREHWTRDQELAYLIHHPWQTEDDLIQGYPSHLHVDLLPRVQGLGIGRQLIDLQLTALRGGGSHGVHLHVRPTNQRALSFYDHLGFTRLRTGYSHVLGMRLG